MSTFLDELLKYAIPAVGAGLSALLGVAFHRAAGWFKAKTGVNMDTRITSVLDRAIAYGEEAARKWLKEKGTAMESKVKHSVAVSFAVAKFKALGLPPFAVDLLGQMIEARLGELRARIPKA